MKKLFLLVFSLLIIFTAGCTNNSINSSITSDIEEYSAFMSSVPGFPLIANENDPIDTSKYDFIWLTDNGEFLDWDVKVDQLGKEATNIHRIYWSPLSDEVEPESAVISLTIISKKTGATASSTQIIITKDENSNIYRIK